MKPYVIKNKQFIEFFSKLPSHKKRKFVPILSRDHINTISEVCKNFLNYNVTKDPNIIKKLKPSKKEIKSISLKTIPLYKKKNILQSRKGGAILSILLPIAASIITSLLTK